jgi:hypothetical protein
MDTDDGEQVYPDHFQGLKFTLKAEAASASAVPMSFNTEEVTDEAATSATFSSLKRGLNLTDFAESFQISAKGTFGSGGINMNKNGIKGPVLGPANYIISSDNIYFPPGTNLLGKGACAVVKKAIYKPAHTILAVKVFDVFEESKRYAIEQPLNLPTSQASNDERNQSVPTNAQVCQFGQLLWSILRGRFYLDL